MEMNSYDIEAKIQKLQELKCRARKQEARKRCKAIFGDVPRGYCDGIEEMFGAVARVYVLRAHKRDDLRQEHLPDHEWIALWHKYEPELTVKELIEVAHGYVAGGCGVAG